MLKHVDPTELTELPVDTSTTQSKLYHTVARRTGKAFEVLAEQPESLAGLNQDERGMVVISAVMSEAGYPVVVSRVYDPVWDLSPFLKVSNAPPSIKRINWACIPECFRQACKNVIYAYWKLGRPGWQAPGVNKLQRTLQILTDFCRYLQSVQIDSFADVQPLHVHNYVHKKKSSKLSVNTLVLHFAVIELLYHFRDEHEAGLQFHPWPESSAAHIAGDTGQQRHDNRKVGLTPLIPAEVAKRLTLYALGILERADALLDERDAGKRAKLRDPEILTIRDACGYLISVLTGIRNSELSSIEVGAGRTEHKGAFTFHWLTATEYKTKKGVVDYLMPSMGNRILAVMERWSQPYRELLAEKIIDMEQQSAHSVQDLQWLQVSRDNLRRVFLGYSSRGIWSLSSAGWNPIFKKFALDAGTKWSLSSHQFRRLYAYTFVKHKLGTLLFLKEQFKHSSIDMSQLYAANPRQDASLYDDILDEIYRQKAEVVANWLDKDEPLAGGAGKRIMELRAQDFGGRREMLEETSKRVLMRSTGHAWCLSQDGGCGGAGLYEQRACHSCGNGVIDSVFVPIWLEAYRHHKELLKDAEAMGPGFESRVRLDLEREAKVLRDLGKDPDALNLTI